MKNGPLLKLSALSTAAGIFLLYMSAVHMEAKVTPISEINEEFIGQQTEVSGEVVDLYDHPDGHLFTRLKDKSGGVILVPFFSETYRALDEEIDMLDRVQIKGKVTEYEGDLELIPSKSEGIKIINTPPLDISKIDRNRLGDLVKIEGFIEKKQEKENKLIIVLQDKKKHIEAVMSSYNANYNSIKEIQKGTMLQITGKVIPSDAGVRVLIQRGDWVKNIEEK